MRRRLTTFALMLACGLPVLEGATVSRQQADSMARKITIIERQGAEKGRAGARRRTPMSEGELNSWFVYHAPPLLPKGLAEPKLTIVDNRTVVGTAVLDLDAVAKSRATGGVFDIWNLIGGRLPVTLKGVVRAQGGRGRFDLQSAEVSGISLPPRVVQQLVDYYSRTPSHPEGLRLDEEYELPAGIRDIELSPGAAVVVQ
jgi:hypothetical protein